MKLKSLEELYNDDMIDPDEWYAKVTETIGERL